MPFNCGAEIKLITVKHIGAQAICLRAVFFAHKTMSIDKN